MQLDAAREHFLVQLRANGRSEHTVRQYHRHLVALGRWLDAEGADEAVEGIDHVVLARFLSSPAALQCPGGSWKRASSVNALRASLRAFFAYLHGAGFVASNAARMVKLAGAGAGPPRALSGPQRERLLSELGEEDGPRALRDAALFHLMLGTGIRLGSALALDVEDLDLERGEVLLRRTKGGSAQRAFLPAGVVALLRRQVGDRQSGPVFPGSRGRALTARSAQRRFAEWLGRCGGGDVSPHGLRHTFAMELYRKTRDVLLVKRALGHRSLSSTMQYAHAEDEDLRRVIQGVS